MCKRTVIVSGGMLEEDFVLPILEAEETEFIIGVDKGLAFLYEHKIKPDYIVGDFDSTSDSMKEYLDNRRDRVTRLNPIKDDTDTEAALRLAFEKTKGDIIIFGGTGTRLDHVLGNISILGLGFEENRQVFLVDEHNRIRLVKDRLVLEKKEQFGKYVSVVPLWKQAKGVTLKGFAYPLENAVMEGFTSLGISNEIAEDRAEISVEEGILIVIESKD